MLYMKYTVIAVCYFAGDEFLVSHHVSHASHVSHPGVGAYLLVASIHGLWYQSRADTGKKNSSSLVVVRCGLGMVTFQYI